MYQIRLDELGITSVLPVLCRYSALSFPAGELYFSRREQAGYEVERDGDTARIRAGSARDAAVALAALAAHADDAHYSAAKSCA